MFKSIFREKPSAKWSPSRENWSTSFSEALLLAALFCCLGATPALFGCGYQFTAKTPYVLPENISSLYLGSVENPSTETWLEPSLRNEFRDELTRRGGITWVPEHEAGGRLDLEILNFRSGAKLESAKERTVRSEILLRLEVKLYRSRSRELLASSGVVTTRESFDPQDRAEEQDARERVVELATELAVQRLNQNF